MIYCHLTLKFKPKCLNIFARFRKNPKENASTKTVKVDRNAENSIQRTLINFCLLFVQILLELFHAQANKHEKTLYKE